MSKSTFLLLAEAFSKEDWKKFTKYAYSHYKKGSLQDTLIVAVKNNKKVRSLTTNQEVVEYIQRMENLGQSERTLTNALTKLTSTMESFLVESELTTNPIQRHSLLCSALAKRGAKELFVKTRVQKAPASADRFWDNYHHLKVDFQSYFDGFHDDYKSSEAILQKLIQSTTRFYAEISKFVTLETMNRRLILQENWSAFEILLKSPCTIETSNTELFEHVRLLREKQDGKSLDYLLDYLKGYDKSNSHIVEIVIVHVTSYINRQLKKGDWSRVDDLLALTTTGVENGLYLTNGVLSLRRYLNIVHSATVLQKLEWVTHFIAKYTSLVDSRLRAEAQIVAESLVGFSIGEYLTTSLVLHKHRFKNFDLELRARVLKLQCNFEMVKSQEPYLLDEVRSLKYFLKRNQDKISHATYEGYLTLFRYLEYLSTGKMAGLEDKLSSEQYVMNKTWLSKKIIGKQPL